MLLFVCRALCLLLLVLCCTTAHAPPSHQHTQAQGHSHSSSTHSTVHLPSNVYSWSVVDVQHWLNSIGLSDYSAAVERESVDGESLLSLSMAECDRYLGINKLGHKKKLEREIKKLQLAMQNIEPQAHQASIQPADTAATPAASASSQTTHSPPASASSSSSSPSGASHSSSSPSSSSASVSSSAPSTPSSPPSAASKPSKTNKKKRKKKVLSSSDATLVRTLLPRAIHHHQQREFNAAAALYKQIVQIQPDNARAIHMLGLIAAQHEKNSKKAIALIEKSIKLAPEPDAYVNLGNFYLDGGSVERCLSSWQHALALNPLTGGPPFRVRYAEQLYAHSLKKYNEGDLNVTRHLMEEAVFTAAEALYMHFDPDYVPPMSAILNQQLFDSNGLFVPSNTESSSSFNTFSSMSPSQLIQLNSEIHHQVRVVLLDAWLHLGLLHQSQVGMHNQALALAYLERCTIVQPDAIDHLYPETTRVSTIAAECAHYLRKYRSKMSTAPHLFKTSEFEHAYHDAVIRVRKNQVDHSNRARRPKKLIEFLHKTCKTSQAFEMAKLIEDDVLFESPRYPHLYEDMSEIVETRHQFELQLDHLLSEPNTRNLWPNAKGMEWCRFRFYLAYHGLNDKQLMIKLAQVYLRLAPSLSYTSPHLVADPTNGLSAAVSGKRKIKVAFMSAFLTHHPVGKTIQGYIHHLPRDKFTIICYFIQLQGDMSADFYYQQMKKWADKWVEVPTEQWSYIQSVVEQDKPDVLIYPDIGMEPTSYFVSFSRLAPIQAMTFGHPDTSGIPTIDYFISHQHMDDPIKGQEYYSEKLVGLSGVGYWSRALIPPPAGVARSFYGVADQDLINAGVVFPNQSIPTNNKENKQDNTQSQMLHKAATSNYTMYLVTKSVQFFSPAFIEALAQILFRHPQSFLGIVMDTGKHSKGYDIHNVCIDHVVESIESRLRALYLEHNHVTLSSAEQDAQLLRSLLLRHRRHPNDQQDLIKDLLEHQQPPSARYPISGRIRFIDRGDHDYFMNLLQLSDVLLQPFPLDGTTTTLEAVTLGVPTVLHRSNTIGGRMAYAIYQQIQFNQTIAHNTREYVDIAVRLGTDAEFARTVKRELLDRANRYQLFENTAAIDQMSAWLQQAVQDKLKKT